MFFKSLATAAILVQGTQLLKLDPPVHRALIFEAAILVQGTQLLKQDTGNGTPARGELQS